MSAPIRPVEDALAPRPLASRVLASRPLASRPSRPLMRPVLPRFRPLASRPLAFRRPCFGFAAGRGLVVAVALLVLGGCAGVASIPPSEILRSESPRAALNSIPPQKEIPKSIATLARLERGMLQRQAGEVGKSITTFEGAKTILERTQAVSISETALSSTINQNLTAYTGTISDRILIHDLQMLNHLSKQDLASARIEAVQSDETMNALLPSGQVEREFASTRLLAGMVFDLNGEGDQALVFYRRALAVLDARRRTVPPGLAARMIALTEALGLSGENQRLRRRFPDEASVPEGSGFLWVWVWNGLVSTKRENDITVYDSASPVPLRISLPSYAEQLRRPRPFVLQLAPKTPADTANAPLSLTARPLESIEQRVREDLSRALPKLTAKAVTRELSRNALEKSDQGEAGIGTLLAIVLAAADSADLRSWETLPARIDVYGGAVPAGTYGLQATGRIKGRDITISPDEMTAVMIHTTSPVLYVYP